MDTRDNSNNTPDVNSASVVHASAPRIQRKTIVLLLFLTVALIAAIAIIVSIFRNSQSSKIPIPTGPTSQSSRINLKTNYQNPFDRSTQYENPFENLK